MPTWYHTDFSEGQSCCCPPSWKKNKFMQKLQPPEKCENSSAKRDLPLSLHVSVMSTNASLIFINCLFYEGILKGIVLQIFCTSLQFSIQRSFKSLLKDSGWCCTCLRARACVSINYCLYASSVSGIGSSFIRWQHWSALFRPHHRPITNPPLMSPASQGKRWHFTLRPSPFPAATHGRTSAPLRCSFIPVWARRGTGFRWLMD